MGSGGWEADDAAASIHYIFTVSNTEFLSACPSDALQQQGAGTPYYSPTLNIKGRGMAGGSSGASWTRHSLLCRSQKWVRSSGRCWQRQSPAGGCRQRMQAPTAPCGTRHPCAGEGAATAMVAFGVRASIGGAAVPKHCWTSSGCAGCCSITACLWIGLSWLQGWGRAG